MNATASSTAAPRSAERARVESFGRPEDGLREARPWYQWGPYLSRARLGHRARGLQRRRHGLGVLPARPRPLPRLPLGRGRPGRHLRRRAAAVPRARAVERPRPDPQGADVRPDRQRRATTARTPRSTGGTSTRCRATPGCAGATTTRSGRSRTTSSWPRTAGAARTEPEYELLDTGVFDDDRYWIVEVDYAKADPDDLLMRVRVTNAGPGRRRRCTCCRPCGSATPGPGTRRRRRPELRADGDGPRSPIDHPDLGRARAAAAPARTAPSRAAVLRQRDQRAAAVRRAPTRRRTRRTASTTTSCTARRRSTPSGAGTKAACWYRARRSSPARPSRCACGCAPDAPAGDRAVAPTSTRCSTQRRAEADEFYAELTPADATADEARVSCAQAFAGMIWGKQFYPYDVARWLDGDPGQPPPPAGAAARPQRGLAALRRLRHPVDARPVGVPVVRRVGPGLPHRRPGPHRPGVRQVPADPALPRVVPAPERRAARPTSGRSTTSTRRCTPGRRCTCTGSTAAATASSWRGCSHKLLINFTWWVNRQDAEGDNLFEGGFLGLDNIGPIDRSHLPAGLAAGAGRRHRLDGVLRADHAGDRGRARPGHRHAARRPRDRSSSSTSSLIVDAHATARACGTRRTASSTTSSTLPDGTRSPMQVRSMVGVAAAARRGRRSHERRSPTLRRLSQALRRLLDRAASSSAGSRRRSCPAAGERRCCSASSAPSELARVLDAGVRRGRVPLAVRPARAVALPPRAPVLGRARRVAATRRLRAGGVDHRRCSAATPTGAGRSGSR